MDPLIDIVCRMLGGVFQAQVSPLADALDDNPSLAVLEEGRRDAGERATAIRAQLASMYAESQPPSQVDVLAAYVAAKSLLGDLWSVVVSDAQSAPLQAWAKSAIARAVATDHTD